MLYIGVDLGTSAVKLLLMDENGNIQKIVSKEYPLYFPKPGWSEQHPEDWYIKSMEGMKELTSECDKSQVAGISFGGQMHGLVALDKDDNVIRPAILWNDGRTGEETDYLNRVIGKERLSAYTANIAFAGFTAPKILWMKKHEPENFGKISKIMLPKDYLAYKLSGSFCTDVSDASGMLLMDVKNRCWSEEMLDICGITKAQLPALHESYEVVGTLRPGIAEELGLPKSVKVIAGAGDNAAAAVGTGTVGEGRCNISLGTSGTIFISSKKFGVDEHNALHSFAHADGNYHLMGCMLSAAACNKWWSEEILKSKDFAAEQSGITRLGENHVFYLPFWQTAVGGTMEVAGQLVQGGQNIFFAQLADPSTVHFSADATRYFSGEFIFMIFGLPGAALAMYHCAKPEKKKQAGGLLLSAALTCMLTGITEPLEFSFLFVAPLLFGVQVVLAGSAYMIAHMLNIAVGLTFSGGLIDLFIFGILQGNAKTNWMLIIPAGVIYFILYYVIFRFLIQKFQFKTPGREDGDGETKLYTKADYKARQGEQTKSGDPAGDERSI